MSTSRLPHVNAVKSTPTTRQQKAALTRARMLNAAYDLFCQNGFPATTMDAIAQRAGVAVQTLYFTFHTKDQLVQAVHDQTVLGQDTIPPPQQPWLLAAAARANVTDAVHDIALGIATILARVAPMVPAFHAVSADPAGEVWRHGEALRLDGMRDLVDLLTRNAQLRKGLSRSHAGDVLFLALGPETYRTLVLERGWTPAQWSDWATRAILTELFDPPAAPNPKP